MHAASRLALFAAVTLPCLPAQNDYNLDKTAAGTLGATLSMSVSGAPASSLMLVMASYSGGPTPIALFDPNDPRSVQVGSELAAGWFFLFTSPTGTAAINLGLPVNPAFHGDTWHWQTLTVPGATTLVGQISNKVVAQVGLADIGVPAAQGLISPRGMATGFFNRTRNAGMGDFVLAGGGQGSITSATGLQTSEIWDFRTLRAVPGPNLTVSRATHTAVTLQDGRVLLAGGVDSVGNVLSSAEIYDPATNTFTATGSMAGPRTLHAATLMADGRVMVAGGASNLADPVAAISNTLNTAEIWNPATGTWSAAPNLGARRLAPALTLLTTGANAGRVMVSGGIEVVVVIIPLSAVSTNKTQIYNPTTNSWANGPNMQAGRAGHGYNQVTLLDGRVLMTGGVLVTDLLNATNATSIAAAEYLNPATNTWTSVPMAQARSLHTATRLANGSVVVCGGAQGTLTAPTPIDGVERFDPLTNTWTTLPNLVSTRGSHAAALLPDGLLVLLGGQGGSGGTTLSNCEVVHF